MAESKKAEKADETKDQKQDEPKDEPKEKAPKVEKLALEKGEKGVEVTATRNISLMMIMRAKNIPAHLRRHPGGARVEAGTKIVVSKKVAEYLKKIGYAK